VSVCLRVPCRAKIVPSRGSPPGEINLNDTPEIAHQLFGMLDFIVEDRIARPKQIRQLYDRLPRGARDAIAARDAAAAKSSSQP
jgi:hypothetical protein